MHDFDFYGEEEMFEPDDSFDSENVYTVPIDIVVYLRNKVEPIFAQHVFFFEKEDPVETMEELMSFTTTWWSAIHEDKNIDYIFLTDVDLNKKAIKLSEIVSLSFIRPEQPEWMNNGQNNSDSG